MNGYSFHLLQIFWRSLYLLLKEKTKNKPAKYQAMCTCAVSLFKIHLHIESIHSTHVPVIVSKNNCFRRKVGRYSTCSYCTWCKRCVEFLFVKRFSKSLMHNTRLYMYRYNTCTCKNNMYSVHINFSHCRCNKSLRFEKKSCEGVNGMQ